MILLISEDPIEEMSLLLYEQLKNKTNVHLIPHNEIPFNKNISFFCKNGKLLGKIGDIDINEISAIYARFDKINIKENISETTKQQINIERLNWMNTILENIDAMVINRSSAQYSNSSKLFQSWIIRQYGFKIPNSLITTSEESAKNFIENNKQVIYKSASSERSMVKTFQKEDFDKLHLLKNCPHLFQEQISGTDIRVHTLATGETYACEIQTQKSDYRYDKERILKIIDIPQQIKEQCVKLTLDLGLYLSGIDLRRSDTGDYYCFEVNPSPAFSWYEEQTGLPISNAVANMMLNANKYKKLAIRKY